MKIATVLLVASMAVLGAVTGHAVPLAADDASALTPAPAASAADASPAATAADIELETWVDREAEAQAVQGHVERERGALLRQPYHPRAPTWIQSAVTVNIGDFPSLDREDERGERELETTLWLLEDSARRAARAAAGPAPQETEESRLRAMLRALLPARIISLVKDHRDWVAVGGIALLTLAGAYTALATGRSRSGVGARRTSGVAATASAAPDTKRRRRRRRHHHHRSTHGGVSSRIDPA